MQYNDAKSFKKFIEVAEKLYPGLTEKVNAAVEEENSVDPLRTRLAYINSDLKDFKEKRKAAECRRAEIDSMINGIDCAISSLESERDKIQHRIFAEIHKDKKETSK